MDITGNKIVQPNNMISSEKLFSSILSTKLSHRGTYWKWNLRTFLYRVVRLRQGCMLIRRDLPETTATCKTISTIKEQTSLPAVQQGKEKK